eukprot:m.141074 g.141074  ORF g.141074 m.141074 type:complete len:85 (+) comp9632_c0_seq1:381-635(+)
MADEKTHPPAYTASSGGYAPPAGYVPPATRVSSPPLSPKPAYTGTTTYEVQEDGFFDGLRVCAAAYYLTYFSMAAIFAVMPSMS